MAADKMTYTYTAPMILYNSALISMAVHVPTKHNKHFKLPALCSLTDKED